MFSYMTFVLPLFYLYISPSFGASERLCFVIVAFSGDIHLYVFFCSCLFLMSPSCASGRPLIHDGAISWVSSLVSKGTYHIDDQQRFGQACA